MLSLILQGLFCGKVLINLNLLSAKMFPRLADDKNAGTFELEHYFFF